MKERKLDTSVPRFLNSITFLGDDILIPIDRIKFITISYIKSYVIKIISDENVEVEEYFADDADKANERFEQIKEIVGAK